MRYAIGVALVGALLALIAIADLPYGYYTFARVIITIIAVVLIVLSLRAKIGGWLFGLVPIAVLWNPIFPVYLTRGAWLPLDLLAAAFLITFAVIAGVRLKSDRSTNSRS